MPNKNRSKKSKEMARSKTLAYHRVDEPDMLPYCRKCPVRKDCDCTQFSGYGMIKFWCRRNPNEKRVVSFPGIQKAAIDAFERIFPEGAEEIRRNNG